MADQWEGGKLKSVAQYTIESCVGVFRLREEED